MMQSSVIFWQSDGDDMELTMNHTQRNS